MRPVRAPLAAASLASFASGGAALVYQVAWQRILALHTGVGVYSIAVIVAAQPERPGGIAERPRRWPDGRGAGGGRLAQRPVTA